MELLVVGGNGLLGSVLVAEGLDRSFDVSTTYHSEPPAFDVPSFQLDVRDTERVEEILGTVSPDIVVNCAAMTDVDGCESAPEGAFEVNAEAPGSLAASTAERGIGFVHVSTDYVFDGRQRAPYAEEAEPSPVQTYGESKLAGEQAILERNERALMTRLSFVYGRRGDTRTLEGFPAWVDDELAAGETVPLFSDQWITPSRAGAAASTILELIAESVTGVVHVASRSCVTPFEFGQKIAAARGHDTDLITEGSMADVDRTAERPRYTCLATDRVERVLGRPQPALGADLEALF